MANYNEAIKEHARIAVKLYHAKLTDIEQMAGIKILPDGSNTASSAADVQRYLTAIQRIAGAVAYISAKMAVTNAINKLGLPPVSL